MASIIVRSAESGHWYGSDGSPQYSVKAKNGNLRATTLADARKHGLVPSVTTVMKVAAAPGLEVWKQEQLLLAALTLPKRPDESEKDYITRIVADSKETGKAAAERGTRIHESIEKWFDGDKKVEHPEIAEACMKAINDHFDIKDASQWVTEASFADPLGFGGKVDLHSPHGIVVDYKTKEFTDPDDVKGYDEHVMQLAAYRIGLGIPEARCANAFASVNEPGLIKMIEWTKEELQRGWAMFSLLLKFWKLKNKFGESDEHK
jgi:hypothetical protein